ncbi:MAG: LysR family transcriptional regulator [Azospirillaceae bacterium]|nr:LysR family transcriptional regulator [Azospirillaceae bacterium]
MPRSTDALDAWKNPISLRQLRFFVELARTGNFCRTAEEMAVSQPAISAGIRQIEAHLGIRLFDRTTHKVTLTDAGISLLPHARRLLTTAANAFSDMHEVAGREIATVRIGAIPTAMEAVAMSLVELAGDMPGVVPHLHDGRADQLIRGLRGGTYDLVVTVQATPDPDLEGVPLFEDEMLLVARADHPLAIHDRLPWRALAGQEIVHFAGGSIGELTSAALQQNDLAPSARYRVDQINSLYGLVLSGLAIGVMPWLYTRGFPEDRLRLIRLDGPTVRRQLRLLHRPQLREEHPRGTEFAERLTAKLRAKLGASQGQAPLKT